MFRTTLFIAKVVYFIDFKEKYVMKKIRMFTCLTALMFLAIPVSPFAQNNSDDQTRADSLRTQIVRELRSYDMTSNIDSIGEREIETHKYFIDKREEPIRQFGRGRHLAVKMPDVIVLGKVEAIRHSDAFLDYGRTVSVLVVSSIKGPHKPGEIVYIKQVSGIKFHETPAGRLRDQLRGRTSSTFFQISLTSDPEFHVGEKVLVFLTKTPYALHFVLSDTEVAEIDKERWKMLWYKTHLSVPNEYELQTRMKARYKIDGDRIRWFNKDETIGSVINKLQSF